MAVRLIGQKKLNEMLDSDLKDFINAFFNPNFPTVSNDYPKYNIIDTSTEEKLGFIIELAVAGFDRKALKVSSDNNVLKVRNVGEITPVNYFYKGISTRDFHWKLKLPDKAKVDNVSLKNGILSITIGIDDPTLLEKEYEITE